MILVLEILKEQKIFNYIKELEAKINGYKIKEKDYKDKIEEQTKEIEKAERLNQSLKQSIQKLDKKISLANTLTAKNKKQKK